MSIRTGRIVLCVFLVFTSVASHADPGAPTSSAEAVAPPPAPAEMSQLSIFEGEWKAKGTIFASPLGPEHPIELRWKAVRDLDGYWVVIRFEAKRTKVDPYPGKGIYQFTYDAAQKQYVALWSDNRGGWATQTSPGWQGDTITFTGDYVSFGRKITVIDAFTRKSARELVYRCDLVIDGQTIPFAEELLKR